MDLVSAEQLYKRNPELKSEDVQHLRDWMAKQSHLPKVPDEQIILFLHACGYKLEPSKVTIDKYYTIRTHSPELFGKRDPQSPEMQELLKVVHFQYTPMPDPNGYVVLIGKLVDFDASKFVHNDLVRALYMAEDIYLAENGTVPGFCMVIDFNGMSMAHLARINFSTLKKYLIYLQEAFPAVLGVIHMINMSPAADKLFNMMKVFMKGDLLSKIKMHSDMESFYKFVPKDVLPKDYGGELESMQVYQDQLLQKLKKYREWLQQEEAFRVEESRRVGKAQNASEVFGMEGSFKKLDID